MNVSSLSGDANVTFHGHASWEVWPLTHIKDPFSTGRRTLRRERLASDEIAPPEAWQVAQCRPEAA